MFSENIDGLTVGAIIVGVLQLALLVIVGLFKRTLSDFDEHNATQDARLNRHADMLGDINRHIARVEEYMDNAKTSRKERSVQLSSLNDKLDSLIRHSLADSKK